MWTPYNNGVHPWWTTSSGLVAMRIDFIGLQNSWTKQNEFFKTSTKRLRPQKISPLTLQNLPRVAKNPLTNEQILQSLQGNFGIISLKISMHFPMPSHGKLHCLFIPKIHNPPSNTKGFTMIWCPNLIIITINHEKLGQITFKMALCI